MTELAEHMKEVGNVQVDLQAHTVTLTGQNPLKKDKVLQLGTINFSFK